MPEQQTQPLHPGQTVIYQIVPEANSLMMCYVVKTDEDHVIVIDGGIDGEGKSKPPYLLDALRVITGQAKPVVQAWIFTHAHIDHLGEFIKLAQSVPDQFQVESFLFHFPSEEKLKQIETAAWQTWQEFDAALHCYIEKNPSGHQKEDNFVVWPGDRITVDTIRIDILQIWDEADPSVNDTSLVFRLEMNGKRMLFLADLATKGGERLLKQYGETLKSDMVQMAHHGQNGVRQPVYKAIQPQVCFWPTPIWVWENRDASGQIGKGPYETTVVRHWLKASDAEEPDFAQRHVVSCLAAKQEKESWEDALKRMAWVVPEA